MNSSKVNTRGLQHFHPLILSGYHIAFKGKEVYV